MIQNNAVGMEVQVRIDLNELSQMLNNDQIRAVMVGIGQVMAACRHTQSLSQPSQQKEAAPRRKQRQT